MPLIDRHVLRSPIDLRSGSQNQALQRALSSASVEHMRGPVDVGLNHVERVLIGVRDRDQGTEVKHALAVRHSSTHGLGIFEVPSVDLDGLANLAREVIKMPAVVAA